MNRLYKFAEKAIETAGEVGAEKREARRLSDIRTEAGLTTRAKAVEAGRETRHKREYGAPGIGDPGGFRYAELASKKEAGTRLSAANQTQARKQQLETYDIKTEALFSPHMQYSPEGEATMPSQLRNIFNVGRAMSLDDPEGAQKYVKAEVAAYTKSAKQGTRMKELEGLSKEQLSAYVQSLQGGGRAGGVAPAPAAASVAPASRVGLSPTAARLRGEYEAKHPTPVMGAGVLKRLGEAWKKRKEPSAVGSPAGLGGYMATQY